jgi:hypothetical protein
MSDLAAGASARNPLSVVFSNYIRHDHEEDENEDENSDTPLLQAYHMMRTIN